MLWTAYRWVDVYFEDIGLGNVQSQELGLGNNDLKTTFFLVNKKIKYGENF